MEKKKRGNPQNLKPIKKGEVRNPKGRPKGLVHSTTRLKRLLELVQNRRNPVTGEMEQFSVVEQMDMAIVAKALRGDINAYRELLDRLEGKPKQTIDQVTQTIVIKQGGSKNSY